MKIEYIYNDIDSVNTIYNSFDKLDKYYLNAGKINNKNYIINPKGDFATKYIYEDDFGFIITMLIDNTPVAYVQCMRAYDTDSNKYLNTCDIDFGVHSEYRHRGIAKKILSYAFKIIKRDKKYQIINWYTVYDNKASSVLAEKIGFKCKETFDRNGTKIKHYECIKRNLNVSLV